MKLRAFILVLSTIVIFSCGRNPNHMSRRYLISRNTFTDILVDIHMMDAITNGPEFYRKFGATDSLNINEEIFRKYDVTKAKFDSTMVYYSRNPEQYLKIYDDVILRLNLKLDKLRNNEPSFKKEDEKKSRKNPDR
jgi:hypothetical protein